MDAARRPLHLLLFGEALGNDLVDGGFHERRRDQLAVAMPLGIVRDHGRVVGDVGAKLAPVPQELARLRRHLGPLVRRFAGGIRFGEVEDVLLDVAHQFERAAHIAVPQEAPHPFEGDDDRDHGLLVRRRQPLGHLLQDGEAHGDMEIVEDVLGVRPHVPLKVAYSFPTVGHERHLAVHADALLAQDFV